MTMNAPASSSASSSVAAAVRGAPAPLTSLPQWQALLAHRDKMASVTLADLFAADAGRGRTLSLQLEKPALYLDYSKNPVTAETLALLQDLLRARDFEAWRAAMFGGEKINTTENRAVLHTALRNRSNAPVSVDGVDVMPAVNGVLEKMRDFCLRVHSGAWTGYSGKTVTDIVHIGIGGSTLGPQLVTEALATFHRKGLRAHFVSNVDGTHIAETLAQLSPETTLFLVASKTFTTQETMANAATARQWLVAHSGDEGAVSRHFVALSTNADAVAAFGIDAANMFPFWDWVGGRYSLWSAIGLVVALACGMERFEQLLTGAHEMDRHFRTAPPHANMPVILALTGIWHRNFRGCPCYAVLPYDQRLRGFARWLQQIDMESNGKRVDRAGNPVDYATGPIVFGEAGTDSQHSFFQLMHQGTDIIPADFIVCRKTWHAKDNHHAMLLSNCLAQAEAFMRGEENRSDPQRHFPGNRPSAMLVLESLTPESLGALMALYEHKVFVQGVVWGINSFDQFGVELGKKMANTLLDELSCGKTGQHDSSTAALIEKLR